MAGNNATQKDGWLSLSLEVDSADAVVSMLIHLFGGDSDADEPSKVPGAGLSIQCAAAILTGIVKTLEDPSQCRLEVLQPAQHAAALAEMLAHLVGQAGFEFRFKDAFLCEFLEAIHGRLEVLKQALNDQREPVLMAA